MKNGFKDPVLRRIIDEAGFRPLPETRHTCFESLAHAIVSQQLAAAAARKIWKRFVRSLGYRVTPGRVRAASTAQLRQAGLSRPKSKYLRTLARAFDGGRLNPRRFRHMTNPQVVDALVGLPGIGVWTAEMFLIFKLRRPDILPVDDYGLRRAIRIAYRLRRLPGPDQIRRIGARWKPHQSLACWQLWKFLERPGATFHFTLPG
jgi:DNA-3-methyladenine glycosylase II